MAEPSRENCGRCARRVPWLSLWGNLGLALYKAVVGTIGGSAALVADALHSFADVIGSTGILVATKVSAKEPDAAYPYGRGKAEFIGAAFVYTLLLFFAGFISYHAIRSLMQPALAAPHFVTLLGAIVSVFYNYIMYSYATCVGKRNGSPAILADAFENRADAISSVACVAGILGAIYIHPMCDPIAALGVGIIIFWNCQEQLREAAHGLMDEGLPRNEVELMRTLATRHEGVVAVSFARSRRTGARYWMDMGIEVADDTSVSRADTIAAAVRDDLRIRPQFHHVEVFVLPTADHAEDLDEAAASLAI